VLSVGRYEYDNVMPAVYSEWRETLLNTETGWLSRVKKDL
jgi:hypothetical protein